MDWQPIETEPSDLIDGASLLAGIFLGALAVSIIAHFTDNRLSESKRLQEECEQALPRNQECVMRYVPLPTPPPEVTSRE